MPGKGNQRLSQHTPPHTDHNSDDDNDDDDDSGDVIVSVNQELQDGDFVVREGQRFYLLAWESDAAGFALVEDADGNQMHMPQSCLDFVDPAQAQQAQVRALLQRAHVSVWLWIRERAAKRMKTTRTETERRGRPWVPFVSNLDLRAYLCVHACACAFRHRR